jgi:hypothetical protein
LLGNCMDICRLFQGYQKYYGRVKCGFMVPFRMGSEYFNRSCRPETLSIRSNWMALGRPGGC